MKQLLENTHKDWLAIKQETNNNKFITVYGVFRIQKWISM